MICEKKFIVNLWLNQKLVFLAFYFWNIHVCNFKFCKNCWIKFIWFEMRNYCVISKFFNNHLIQKLTNFKRLHFCFTKITFNAFFMFYTKYSHLSKTRATTGLYICCTRVTRDLHFGHNFRLLYLVHFQRPPSSLCYWSNYHRASQVQHLQVSIDIPH